MMKVLRAVSAHKASILLLLVILLALHGMTRSSAFRTCHEQHAQYLSYQPGEGWFTPAWIIREVKASIKCTADFTEHNHGPLTALGTVLLALFTTTLWWATSGLLRHAPKVERAYVFGGCGDQKDVIDPITNAAARWVRATHGNYGKTPAFVERIAVEHCLEKDLPARPKYAHYFEVNEPLSPGTMGHPINRVEHTFSLGHGQIYYGRIYYRDIFGDGHHSSFIYRFDANGRHEPIGIGDTNGMVHADYWEFN